ncbi:MAG: YceI family protein, partial [Nitrospinae bacterium]|nr:YceI family protein [Nitrospinota bacterium]
MNLLVYPLILLYLFVSPIISYASDLNKLPLNPQNTELSYWFESGIHDFEGKAHNFEGFILVPQDLNSQNYYTETTVDVKSLFSGDFNRDLKAQNYSLEAKDYPEITFYSTKFNGIPHPIKSGEGFHFKLEGI